MNPLSFDAPAVPSARRAYASEIRLALLQLWRTPAFAIPTLLFPLAFYGLFGLLLPAPEAGAEVARYLLASYGAFGVIGPALFGFGVGMAMERQMGWLALKQVSPLPMGAYFAGKLAGALVFGLAVVVGLGLMAAGFGGVVLAPGQWLLLAGVLVLGSLPFCAMGLWVATLVEARAAVAIVNLIYLPMSVLSGLWFPIHFFPEAMQALALLLPAYHLGELALGVVGARQPDVASSAVVLAAYGLLFLALAARANAGRAA
jgi:ABC-2 type transport system permease protein